MAALVAFTGSAAWAQASDSATASSSAIVVKPISIEKLDDLFFGSFEAGTGGAITVPLNGSATKTGGVTILTGQSRAEFKVIGKNGLFFNITGDTEVTLTGPGPSMTATLLKLNSTNLPGVGFTAIFVGGILTVAPGQTPGGYSGTFNITVSYP